MDDITSTQSKTEKAGRWLVDWVVALVIAFALALFITKVLIVNAQIPSESMEDTIMVGDRVVGWRLSYLFSDPQRGDIVIFRYPDDESQLFVKRVIGMPGELLEIKDGRIYINGVEHPEVNSHVKGSPVYADGSWQIPEDGYFVMGDNRANSWDSRYWKNTFVLRSQMIGRAAVRIFPNPTVLK